MAELAWGEPIRGWVLAIFERVCNLVIEKNEPDEYSITKIMSLVAPEIGNGPLNVVLDQQVEWPRSMVGMPVHIQTGCINLGSTRIVLREALVWEPRPDWHALRRKHDQVISRIPLVRDQAIKVGRSDLLSLVLADWRRGSAICTDSRSAKKSSRLGFLLAAEAATKMLATGWPTDLDKLSAGAARLAGLGPGLTPAGDDFLAGLMLWSWLSLDSPRPVCNALLDATIPETATLSGAFLARAALGECNSAWHQFLLSLSEGTDRKLRTFTERILAYGSTSGADTLAGFMFMPSWSCR